MSDNYQEKVISLKELIVPVEHTALVHAFFKERWHIKDVLGAGRSSWVYLAEDSYVAEDAPGRKVALKIAKPGFEDYFREYIRNISVLKGFDHPNVNSLLDVSGPHDDPYVVLEYNKGASLDQLLTAVGKLEGAVVAEIVKQVATGLIATKDIMAHYDINPQNIYLIVDGTVQILDYGLDQDNRSGLQGSLLQTKLSQDAAVGKVGYIAPEVIEGKGDHRSDVWSLGRTLFKLLTGKLPSGTERPRDMVGSPAALDMLYEAMVRPVDQRMSLGDVVENITNWQGPDSVSALYPVSIRLDIGRRTHRLAKREYDVSNLIVEDKPEPPVVTSLEEVIVVEPAVPVEQEVSDKEVVVEEEVPDEVVEKNRSSGSNFDIFAARRRRAKRLRNRKKD